MVINLFVELLTARNVIIIIQIYVNNVIMGIHHKIEVLFVLNAMFLIVKSVKKVNLICAKLVTQAINFKMDSVLKYKLAMFLIV